MTKDVLRVYVDGFNLYHGLHDIAGRRLLWLDLVKLAELLRPRSTVDQVHYFTAPVVGEPDAASRQAEYQNALEALHPKRLRVTQGRYQTKTKRCRKCHTTWQEREEKETDVNIAVSLVADAARGAMTTAMLLSADSDLSPAVRTALNLNPSLTVFAAFPPKRYSAELKALMPSSFQINPARIRKCLLPDTVPGTNPSVVFTRPTKWA